MATAGEGRPPDFDLIRRRYLAELAEYTERPVILYASAGFSAPPGAQPSDVQISLEPDVSAFMEVVHGLPTDGPLDLILHSPGGNPDAAESIVEYLRGRFPGLRVIVPIAAMSAATMLAMAADEIILGAHSQLGPIDPQLTIQTPEGPRSAPAAAIRAQFIEATEDLKKHPDHALAWLPLLRSLSPALLQICDSAERHGAALVGEWLAKYMFAEHPDREAAVKRVVGELSSFEKNLSHGRRIGRERLRELDVKVVDLEDDQELQDRVLSVYHATNHTFGGTPAVKIVENHLGKAYIKIVARHALELRPGPPSDGAPSGAPFVLPGQPQGNRAQRRQGGKKGR